MEPSLTSTPTKRSWRAIVPRMEVLFISAIFSLQPEVMNYGETEDFTVSCFAEAWLTSPVGLPAGAAEAFLSTGASPRSAGVRPPLHQS